MTHTPFMASIKMKKQRGQISWMALGRLPSHPAYSPRLDSGLPLINTLLSGGTKDGEVNGFDC